MSSRENLMLRYAMGDLRRNRAINIALFVLLVLSATLMATGAMVIERLTGSVDALFAQAKPPHFLQMHVGDYDAAALEDFAGEQSGIESWTVVDMYGFDSSAISWTRPASGESGDLSDSLVDNLFVTQNPDFDYLIDQDGVIAEPAAGEVYVPVAYQQRFGLQVGDELGVRTDDGLHDLTVTGFVRDAQMASSLSSATRFLVSETDWTALAAAGGGDPEIIVEYRLHDPSGADALQAAYEADDTLPKNGQAVTYEMIRLINAFSDGLVAVALIFASLLLILIALLNLRFVIRGSLQDEVREIGAMKAIGIPSRQISRLYLGKYSVMTLLACVLGGALALPATAALTRGAQATYAAAETTVWTVLVPVVALLLVYVIVVAICAGVLRAVRRIDVVGALVHGSTLTERQTARRARRQSARVRRRSLARYRGRHIGRRLAMLDLRSQLGQWVLVPVVFFLTAIMITLPLNLLTTFESPRFVSYMGAPTSDLRADLLFSDDVDRTRDDLLGAMADDDRLDDVRVFANVLVETEGPEGMQTLRVEVGDYTTDTVDFVSGTAPGNGQIALSVLNADAFGLQVGDPMEVTVDGTRADYTVSGVYQDVTSGGRTAKMQGEVARGAAGYVVYADLSGDDDPAAVATEYGDLFPGAAVVPMAEYVTQTLEYVTSAFRTAAVLSVAFGLAVALLITALFLRLRLSRDRRSMGVLSAIGFSARELTAQVRGKTLLVVTVGTVLGVLFAATVGESMTGGLLALAGLGIAHLTFLPNVWLAYLVLPLALIGAGYLGAVLLTARLRRADKSSWLSHEGNTNGTR
ncbi:FtsX-like permease family protein [Microbacterium sp.]|uniref:FtsX-like permease family protein n=1 Tax=Microbacterium sp. TaxID=51671 RepID=UPI003A844FC0